MVYKVVRSTDSDHDLVLIFEHLVESYMSFGETAEDAFDRALRRLDAIEDQLDALVQRPHQGTILNQVRSGLRSLTKNKVVIYFSVEDAIEKVSILAFFFGGQDHRRRIVSRLKAGADD